MDIPQIIQLGGLGVFAYILLRHTLAQSNRLVDKIDNHLEHHLEALAEIRDSLKEISLELRQISKKA